MAKTPHSASVAAGKRLKIGKACVHYTKASDLTLDAIGDIIAAMPVDTWIAAAESWRRR